MAVNRLILILIVVMLMSTLAAALAPVQPEDSAEETTTSPSLTSAEDRGRRLHATLRAPNEGPHPIGAAVGDALALDVLVATPGYVSIPDLGRLEFATPDDPAEFFLYLRGEGRYDVRYGERERLIGTIVVVERD